MGLKSIDDEKQVKPSPSKKIKNDPSPSTKIKEPKKVPTAIPSKTITSPKLPAKNGKKSPKADKSIKEKSDEIKQPVIKKRFTEDEVKKEIPKCSPKKVEEVSKAIAQRPQSEPTPADCQLWVDKYKPTSTKGIIGQQTD